MSHAQHITIAPIHVTSTGTSPCDPTVQLRQSTAIMVAVSDHSTKVIREHLIVVHTAQ
jgi:hypothetical protein